MASHCPQDEMKTQHFSKILEIWLPLTLYSHLFLITLFTKLNFNCVLFSSLKNPGILMFQFIMDHLVLLLFKLFPFSCYSRHCCSEYPYPLPFIPNQLFLKKHIHRRLCKISIKLIPFHYVIDFPPNYENSHLINLFSSNLIHLIHLWWIFLITEKAHHLCLWSIFWIHLYCPVSIMSGSLEAEPEMRILVLVIYWTCSLRRWGKQDRAEMCFQEESLLSLIPAPEYQSRCGGQKARW